MNTEDAIAGSGGLEEVFFLPLMIIAAVIVGSIGSAVASVGRRLLPTA